MWNAASRRQQDGIGRCERAELAGQYVGQRERHRRQHNDSASTGVRGDAANYDGRPDRQEVDRVARGLRSEAASSSGMQARGGNGDEEQSSEYQQPQVPQAQRDRGAEQQERDG